MEASATPYARLNVILEDQKNIVLDPVAGETEKAQASQNIIAAIKDTLPTLSPRQRRSEPKIAEELKTVIVDDALSAVQFWACELLETKKAETLPVEKHKLRWLKSRAVNLDHIINPRANMTAGGSAPVPA